MLHRLDGSVPPPALRDAARPTPERPDLADPHPASAAGPPPRPRPAACLAAGLGPRREGTLGKLRLSPIAEVLRTKAKAEQPEPAVTG